MSSQGEVELEFAIKCLQGTQNRVADVLRLKAPDGQHYPQSPQHALNELRLVRNRLDAHIRQLEVFEETRLRAAAMQPPKALYVLPDGSMRFEDAHNARPSDNESATPGTDGESEA